MIDIMKKIHEIFLKNITFSILLYCIYLARKASMNN